MKDTLPTVELAVRRNSLHPWIFQKMVRTPKIKLAAGTLVTVTEKTGEFVGRGIYNPNGGIGIRILTELESEQLDRKFFETKLAAAKNLRENVLKISETSDSYRLTHGEGDGLSGLIIDKYADVLVVEPYSAGYLRIMDWIAEILGKLYPKCRVAVRPDAKQSEREGVSEAAEAVARSYPVPDSVEIRENGMRLAIHFKTGHKTGFFLDQRENRFAVRQMAEGKDVLDLFCYTGGFSVSAGLGRARSVTGVDLDEKALKTAEGNLRVNNTRANLVHRNVFDFLRASIEKGERSDLVVVDPSKLAGVKDEISRGKKTYGDLNRLAMKALRPGGILLTCSCSGLISEPDFLSILYRSAAEAGVVLQIVRISGASPDHPFSSVYPEGRYLKSVLARVLPFTSRRIVSEAPHPSDGRTPKK